MNSSNACPAVEAMVSANDRLDGGEDAMRGGNNSEVEVGFL